MKNLLLSATILAASTTGTLATDLTILNAGSKTGSFAMQSTAYAQDLGSAYNVTLDIPGDYCVAVKGILPTIDHAVLMPWASDFESIGRDGEGCAAMNFDSSDVILHTSEATEICSMSGQDITTVSGQVGHTVPSFIFARLIDRINDVYGTEHTNVPYDGSGATRTALINGEVDYVLTYPKHARYIEQNGGQCLFSMDDAENGLALTSDTVWLAFNMNDNETELLRQKVRDLHADCDSAIATYSDCGKNLQIDLTATDEDIMRTWEQSVNAQRK